MPDNNESPVREVQQARASTSLPTRTGKAGQLIIDKTDWRIHVMDGTTQGGHPAAKKSEVDALQTSLTTLNGQTVKTVAQTLTDEQKLQALTNLGIKNCFVVPNSAAAHNALFRGENLVTRFGSIANISTAVRAGNFEDIFIGDYIEASMTSSLAGAETVRWCVAGIDSYMNVGDTPTTQHHLVMIAEDAFKTNHVMNTTNTTAGGFKGSYMWTTIIPAYNTAVRNAIGSSYVLSHRELISNDMNSSLASMAGAGWGGASSGWEWVDAYLMLPSEVQVYGSTVFSSSFFDVGNRNRQLPYFALRQDKLVANLGMTGGRASWWLSAVAGAAYFAIVSGYGFASYDGASVAWVGIRPLFLFS